MNELWLREETERLDIKFEEVIELIQDFIDKPTVANRNEIKKEVAVARQQLNKVMRYINDRWLKGE